MEWLSQNWIWLAFVVGMVVMMRRGGCCGGRHGAKDKHPEGEGSQTKSAAAGGCCGDGGHGEDDKHPESEGSPSGNAAAGAGHQHQGAAQS